MRLRVEVAGVRPQPPAEERLQARGLPRRYRRCGFAGASQGLGQEGRQQDGAAGAEQGLLEGALQLPDVPRPGVTAQALQRLRRDLVDPPSQLAPEALERLR